MWVKVGSGVACLDERIIASARQRYFCTFSASGLSDRCLVEIQTQGDFLVYHMLVPLIIQFFVVYHENDGSGFQWDRAVGEISFIRILLELLFVWIISLN